ncbi:hypothetical protein Tco_0940016 [Tanacetum coccineum]|uniref:Uncharacterized protein n=1 Tax=Tanacetum coccineum TaxID=301880 RepID=A0ABQ5DLR9_9ASTR
MASDPRIRILFRPRLEVGQIGNQSQGYREPGSYTRSWQLQLLLFLLILLMRRVGSGHLRDILLGDIPTFIPYLLFPIVASRDFYLLLLLFPSAVLWLSFDSRRLTTGLCGLVHSLGGLDASDQAHYGSSTRDVSPRLCYPPRRAPRRSEAFRRWCAALLSTLYPPTTSESSSGDSSERPLHSSSHSARPFRKRCRSPVDSVPSSTLVMVSLAPTRADLLPPRKRFRDSYSSKASIEEDTEIDPREIGVDTELGIGDGDDVRDHVEIDPRDVRDYTEEYKADTSVGDTVEVGINPMSAPIVEEEIVKPAGEDSSDSSSTRVGIVRSFEDMPINLDDVVRDFYHHMSEVRIDRIVGIETAQRRLEAD